MEYARRGPKRICSHMIRPSALSAMDILYSKICIDKAIAFLTAYMVGDDEDDTSLAYLSIGISYLQQYTYIEILKVIFIDILKIQLYIT